MNLLKIFHAIYVERSVSEAAWQLGLSQSAVSHALKRLRTLLQDELFVRTGASMKPTARAQLLAEPIRDVVETIERQILPSMTFEAMTARREFVLGMVDLAEIVFLPPLLRFMRQQAPWCRLKTVRVSNEALTDALESGRVEMAIGSVPNLPGHLYQQTIFHHDYVVLASEQHPRLCKGTLTWEQYSNELHIVVSSGTDKNLQDHTLTPRGIKRNIQLTVGGYLSVPWLIEGTDMIATLPSRLADGVASSAHLNQFSLPEPVVPYALQSIWHPRWHKDPGHRWLREIIFELMHRYPETAA
ncbi:LysR family transcriptional regulator [Pseudomonas duriflava]|nr:LysR family transcriptional regulator [Pseudomonas duriflava]